MAEAKDGRSTPGSYPSTSPLRPETVAKPTSGINRRQLLDLGAKSGAVAVVAASPTMLIAAADAPERQLALPDPLPMWWREYRVLDASQQGLSDADAAPLQARLLDLARSIEQTPAATMAGAIAQLEYGVLMADGGAGPYAELLASVLAVVRARP